MASGGPRAGRVRGHVAEGPGTSRHLVAYVTCGALRFEPVVAEKEGQLPVE